MVRAIPGLIVLLTMPSDGFKSNGGCRVFHTACLTRLQRGLPNVRVCLDPEPQRRLFIFGMGYTSLGLVRSLKQQPGNWRISGTCRQPEKAAALRDAGIEVHI